MKLREKFRKNQSVLGGSFLLSSCSLVGLYVSLQVKVTEKKNSEYFSGECLKLKLRLQRKFKIRDFYFTGCVPTGWASCRLKIQSHGLIGKLECNLNLL